jgi:4-oxalocrotonate tautomerase
VKSSTSTAVEAPATENAPEKSFGRTTLPIVTIQLTREGTKPGATSVTAEEKAALIKGASELLLDLLKQPLDATFVIIEEVEMENWGFGDLPVAELRRKRSARSG